MVLLTLKWSGLRCCLPLGCTGGAAPVSPGPGKGEMPREDLPLPGTLTAACGRISPQLCPSPGLKPHCLLVTPKARTFFYFSFPTSIFPLLTPPLIFLECPHCRAEHLSPCRSCWPRLPLTWFFCSLLLIFGCLHPQGAVLPKSWGTPRSTHEKMLHILGCVWPAEFQECVTQAFQTQMLARTSPWVLTGYLVVMAFKWEDSQPRGKGEAFSVSRSFWRASSRADAGCPGGVCRGWKVNWEMGLRDRRRWPSKWHLACRLPDFSALPVFSRKLGTKLNQNLAFSLES